MLIARSSPECRLYMDLHVCSCGEGRFEAQHVLRESDEGALLAVYEGACRSCESPRRFTFTLDDALPPPPPAFGGQQPSSIICPGEFLLVAAEAASSAPAEPAGLSDRQLGTTRDALARAVAAVEEVLKFIPEGADAVPEAAVTSSAGAALYSRDAGRFSRARLEAVLAAYRESLAAYEPA